MKRILYLGLEPPPGVIHCPLIQIVPRPFEQVQAAFDDLPNYTHLLFTSKSAVDIFCCYIKDHVHKNVFAVGQMTAKRLQEQGLEVAAIAEQETAEGLVDLLERQNLEDAYLFWPHSAQSRPVLRDYFESRRLRYRECLLYDTLPLRPDRLPDLSQIDEIHFTSPSTVDAFLQFFGAFPKDIPLKTIGPITEARLQQIFRLADPVAEKGSGDTHEQGASSVC